MHRVAFPVSLTRAAIRHRWPRLDAHSIADAAASLPAMTPAILPVTQKRAEMLAIPARSEPPVNRLMRHTPACIARMVNLQPPRNLLRRPLLRETLTHRRVDLGTVHLARHLTFAAATLCATLGRHCLVTATASVTPQLAADRRRRTPQTATNRRLTNARKMHLRNDFAFFQSKLTLRHRRVSVGQSNISINYPTPCDASLPPQFPSSPFRPSPSLHPCSRARVNGGRRRTPFCPSQS